MSNALVPIAGITLSGAFQQVTFSDIPQTFKDLILITQIISTSGGTPEFQLNSTVGNHNVISLRRANDSSLADNNNAFTRFGAMSSAFAQSSKIEIMDYTDTSKIKAMLITGAVAGDSGGAVGYCTLTGSTAAITSFKISTQNDFFATGSDFYLYGVRG